MYFIVSKSLGWLLVPSNLLLLGGVAGFALTFSRFANAGRRLMQSVFILVILCGVSPIGKWLLTPLESRFPAWRATPEEPTGVIVLGGDINLDVAAARGVVSPANPHRIVMAATLLHRYPQLRALYSGGNPSFWKSNAREADFAVELLGQLGIPRSRIEVERSSRNTAENARFSRELISPNPTERWLLVTSAFHMPRAVGIFCKAGFMVEPVPSGWQTDGRLTLEVQDPVAGLATMDIAVHEWLALLIARLTGKTDSIFPTGCLASRREAYNHAS